MTDLTYLGEFPLMAELSEYVRNNGLKDTPRFAWTTFMGADKSQYKALVLWLPVGLDHPEFQFCPIKPTRPGNEGIAKWAWTWDGNVRHPTLKESIQCSLKDPALYWHGYVQGGCWIPC